MTKNIGFISTRFAGTDGVSLESSKWADVFEQNGYRCFWFGGEVDRGPENSVLVPEASGSTPRFSATKGEPSESLVPFMICAHC